nr:PREDICTED: homocysteine S-methyltransferase 1-like [Bemisia tabaci]
MVVTLLDGGVSTQLANHVDISTVEKGDPLWCARFLVTDKQAVINTHRDYVRAGSDIIETNSYQASIPGFMKYLNLSFEESVALLQESVNLAKQAIEEEKKVNPTIGNVLVAGSCGSYGAFLHDGSEYRGDFMDRVSLEEITSFHEQRMKALVDANVDLLAIETIPTQAEAEILTELLKKFPGIKAWIAFSVKDESHLSCGDDFVKAATSVWSKNPEQLIAVGVNCLNPNFVSPLVSPIVKQIPIIAYPNKGELWDGVNKKWVGQDGENVRPLIDYVSDWLDLGVSYIGGCCRTSASDIAAFRQLIDSRIKGSK